MTDRLDSFLAGSYVADEVYDGLISLPIYADLTEAEQDEVVAALAAEVA